MNIRNTWRRFLFWAICLPLKIRWFVLGGYYARLAVQARYLYRQSDLFKMRWQELDLNYAENTFDNVATHFFRKAKSGPAVIRRRIFMDWILNRPPQPYCLRDQD
ncbi:MAG: hypothetical protein A3B99_03530 [Candidatus Yanofskybacteria bacterium RIFCSPHIGHO2_02_FULL_44_12b]|uniref:Uncharacterized protein n=1 Tax=Candidatus Yanofskybacteria bacterium RIFCSPLOWO2_01_FULL_44_22 TaxID=1802697 RepID=A0A1F8GJV6_9BACT|nr:MAG: hypothetical protein A2659_04060 [Candidatus Yanofskybacteria bacterium RIFCSPHIGHO2_01_FULL_44_24]OGN13927.1 MAG: hypothetical protein A3B99_03530 [Candidatus Yanofskybacteria bacterium RIFCSPHIGHO2_02_FULL_44_12b]OGN25611.1 MAG: hypothetical protein A2925_01810 [Candidatus Yanofskybacteria bacterium RIFCSPLOWO2_01_FULL_44_22]